MPKFDMTAMLPFYEAIEAACVDARYAQEDTEAYELLEHLMDLPNLPMHCPPHHYIMPALLLTLAARKNGTEDDLYREQLAQAKERALNVLPGFCGWYGNCGAAVGLGIFLSIYTGTDPHSEAYWAQCNTLTGKALLRVGEIEGPRCCKRNSYLALGVALEELEEMIGLSLGTPNPVRCKYHQRNAECKKEKCPFYPGEE